MKKYKNKTFINLLIFIDGFNTIEQSSPLSTHRTTVKDGNEIGKPTLGHLILYILIVSRFKESRQ